MAGPTLIVHFDLNKTLLAVDEVKGYGREEIIYLEEYKGDEEFLAWAATNKGPGAATGEEAEAWIKTLKESKNEPELIGFAKEYVAADAERTKAINATMERVRKDNSCESFWRFMQWAKEQEEERVLVVFRTFGVDMPEMFESCEANGFGGDVLLAEGEAGPQPMMWTVLHEMPSSAEYDKFKGTIDHLVDGAGRELITPYPPVPGPKQKGTDEYKSRTVALEEAATALFKAGQQLKPFVYTGAPRIVREGGSARLGPLYASDVQASPCVPVLEALGVNGLLGKIAFEGDARLRIMGVWDNYKPWSRKNWRCGKVIALPPEEHGTKQLVFDDYSFTKSDAEGCYIQALWDEASGAFVDGDKPTLQAKYSGESPFAGAPANVPTIFTALLCKKGKPSAVSDVGYYLSRVQSALKVLRAAK